MEQWLLIGGIVATALFAGLMAAAWEDRHHRNPRSFKNGK